MRARAIIYLAALTVLSTGAAAQEFPDGTFASDKDSCDKLATKTPAELGEDLDFQVLSKKGLIAFQQVCDFVSIVPHNSSSWVATAFCDEAGYTYPDLFSIKQNGERLNVTRVTDLTEGSSVADPDATDEPEAGGGTSEAAPENGASKESQATETQSAPSEEGQSAESYSSFVKCTSVKP